MALLIFLEVMKELLAKKHAKMQKKQTAELISGRDEKTSLDYEHQKLTKHKVDFLSLLSLNKYLHDYTIYSDEDALAYLNLIKIIHAF